MCGGTRRDIAVLRSVRGLSPRVRGNPPARIPNPSLARSIPACAGEPRRCRRPQPPEKVYPRVCGGTTAEFARHIPDEGLSPRVRGNPPTATSGRREAGSIPACAGEPHAGYTIWRQPWVYPRVCGGTVAIQRRQAERQGLSPRVRGNRGDTAAAGREAGSIPACAGEPALQPHKQRHRRVYPRVCGGTKPLPSDDHAVRGLSPRVRGNQAGVDARLMHQGSIPACAGEPGCRSQSPGTPGVYPRVCGGTWASTRLT